MDLEAVLRRMREAVVSGQYVMTTHALMEMRSDGLDQVDVESAVLTGKICQVLEDDPRGTRYEVIGIACDLATPVGVVARFAGPLLIITVYEVTR